MKPTRHYDRAIVPEFLTKLTIEKIPFDTPYYLTPGERDDYEPPAMFVTADRELKVDSDHAIDMDFDTPSNPIGLAGVMRVAIITGNGVRDAYVADLRFLGMHDLVETEDLSAVMGDQEAFMEYVDALNKSVTIEAFIASEEDFDPAEGIDKGTFYGNPELHVYLEMLRKKSDKHLKRFLKQQASPSKVLGSTALASDEPKSKKKSKAKPSKKDKSDKDTEPELTVEFSHRG